MRISHLINFTLNNGLYAWVLDNFPSNTTISTTNNQNLN